MKTLILFRGAPGCGKTTFIAEHGLKEYALCPDDIRLMLETPVLKTDGTMNMPSGRENLVWRYVYDILEKRMQRGCFTVIDATNSKNSDLSRFKKLAEMYRYRIFLVDMTDVPAETCRKRNRNRLPAYKRVPDQVIDNMYARFENGRISSGVTVISPDEFDDKVWLRKLDMNGYRAVNVIGDVHGCLTALKELLGEMKDDEFYIFVGDYLDRGLENGETFLMLRQLAEKENVLLLEGNHEIHLWKWGYDKKVSSREFVQNTLPQLEAAGITQKMCREFYRRLGQCAWFEYGCREFIVTHGGLSAMPENPTLIMTSQMSGGVGDYEDYEETALSFMSHSAENVFQISGHRNISDIAPRVVIDGMDTRCIDLEGHVEFGGELRMTTIDSSGISCRSVINHVFRAADVKADDDIAECSVSDMKKLMRSDKDQVMEKVFGSVSSFNFTRDVFYKSQWNARTLRARGLFIDTEDDYIVARSYDKFFSVEEVVNRPYLAGLDDDGGTLDVLRQRLTFPVRMYEKTNGFLCMLSSHDKAGQERFLATKSSTRGKMRDIFEKNLAEIHGEEKIEKLCAYARENDVTFVFECIDRTEDPHIIEYGENRLVLLDVIANTGRPVKLGYEDMVSLAAEIGIEVKRHMTTIDNWEDFVIGYKQVTGSLAEDSEGCVFEAADGLMLKVKSEYYRFWKQGRNIMERINCDLPIPHSIENSGFHEDLVPFVQFISEQKLRGIVYSDVIEARREFLRAN
jgi:predicted kinase